MKVSENHSFGIGGLYAFQRFAAKGLAPFSPYSSDPSNLSGNRMSTASGIGVRLGDQGRITSQLYIGFAHQTKIAMSNFDQYKGLFASEGNFDIPSNWTAGFAYLPDKHFTFSFDVQQIFFNSVKSVGNPLLPNLQTAKLGNDNGAGFGWENILVFKLGAIWKSSGKLTWMAGY